MTRLVHAASTRWQTIPTLNPSGTDKDHTCEKIESYLSNNYTRLTLIRDQDGDDNILQFCDEDTDEPWLDLKISSDEMNKLLSKIPEINEAIEQSRLNKDVDMDLYTSSIQLSEQASVEVTTDDAKRCYVTLKKLQDNDIREMQIDIKTWGEMAYTRVWLVVSEKLAYWNEFKYVCEDETHCISVIQDTKQMVVGLHDVNMKGIYLTESEFDVLHQHLWEMHHTIDEYMCHQELFQPNQKLLIKKVPPFEATSQYKWEKLNDAW